MESAKDPQQSPDRDQAGNGHLAEINRGMAKGAAWMVAMRFSMRGIGLVSTVILARLLVPADFGLVAMATIIFGLIEVMSQFGFGVFLIQKQNAGHDYYDTAWTLSILRGAVTCGLLFVIAMPVADFFGDPRLVEIFYVLALVALVRSIGNVGVIDFQKNLTFGKDFKLHVAVKLAAFCVTITAAILLRNYWALVIGIATAGFVRVALSYMMHPYRPRLSLARWREIMHFSKWLLANNVLGFLNRQSDGLI
ncbi:MAG: oligosaccharide flippase family protein, partial [Lysobacterales bacterium]